LHKYDEAVDRRFYRSAWPNVTEFHFCILSHESVFGIIFEATGGKNS